MNVVINSCYGGFNLSIEGLYRYCEKKYGQAYVYKSDPERGIAHQVPYSDNLKSTLDYYISPEDHKGNVDLNNINCIMSWNIKRDDPILVAVVRELKEEADGRYSNLRIVEIPDDVKWHIEEYDGMESVHEDHRSLS